MNAKVFLKKFLPSRIIKILKWVKSILIIIPRNINGFICVIIQGIKIKYEYSKKEENLIIFIIPGPDWINGGIISICSIFDETEKLRGIHKSAWGPISGSI